jgi:hypothetical protein
LHLQLDVLPRGDSTWFFFAKLTTMLLALPPG